MPIIFTNVELLLVLISHILFQKVHVFYFHFLKSLLFSLNNPHGSALCIKSARIDINASLPLYRRKQSYLICNPESIFRVRTAFRGRATHSFRSPALLRPRQSHQWAVITLQVHLIIYSAGTLLQQSPHKCLPQSLLHWKKYILILTTPNNSAVYYKYLQCNWKIIQGHKKTDKCQLMMIIQ